MILFVNSVEDGHNKKNDDNTMYKKIITPRKRNPQKIIILSTKKTCMNWSLIYIYIFGIDDPNEINKITTIISHINYVVVIYYINFNNNSS